MPSECRICYEPCSTPVHCLCRGEVGFEHLSCNAPTEDTTCTVCRGFSPYKHFSWFLRNHRHAGFDVKAWLREMAVLFDGARLTKHRVIVFDKFQLHIRPGTTDENAPDNSNRYQSVWVTLELVYLEESVRGWIRSVQSPPSNIHDGQSRVCCS